MSESNKNNNSGTQKPKSTFDHGDYQRRSDSNDRTTSTGQKPAPGHKK